MCLKLHKRCQDPLDVIPDFLFDAAFGSSDGSSLNPLTALATNFLRPWHASGMNQVMRPRGVTLPRDDHQTHEDLGPLLDGVFWSLTILALVFLLLRLYSKLSRRRALWLDDYFLIVAWVCIRRNLALSLTYEHA